MSDLRSKLPDFKEFVGIASKFFSDMKTSASEIAVEYKRKHFEATAATKKNTPQSSTHTAEATKITKKESKEKERK